MQRRRDSVVTFFAKFSSRMVTAVEDVPTRCSSDLGPFGPIASMWHHELTRRYPSNLFTLFAFSPRIIPINTWKDGKMALGTLDASVITEIQNNGDGTRIQDAGVFNRVDTESYAHAPGVMMPVP